MPSQSAPTLRKKAHNTLVVHGAEPEHGHVTEYVLACLALITNFSFIVGSVFFYTFMSEFWVTIGDWIFIVGSLVAFLISLHHVHETQVHINHAKRRVSILGMSSMEGRRLRNELLENIFFAIACFIFAVASAFFMPGIYGDHVVWKEVGLQDGALLFLVASFLMVFATFFATIEMAADPEHHGLKPGSPKLYCHTLHVIGLACAQLGAVCFTVGSALYRPCFAVHAAAANEGTTFYVVGSALLTVESCLGLAVVHMKAKYEDCFNQSVFLRDSTDSRIDGMKGHIDEEETVPLLAAKTCS